MSPELDTLAGRLVNEDLIDAKMAEWVAQYEAYDVQEKLQQADLAAGVAQTIEDKVERDSQLQHRGFYAKLDHPVLGTRLYEGLPVKMAGFDVSPRRRTPLLGEHTRQVLAEILGYSESRLEELVRQQIIADPQPLEEEAAK